MEGTKIAAIARKHALLNAAKFDGTAQLKAVIGKVMAEVPGDAQDIIPVVRAVVAEVNQLSLAQQQEAIDTEELAPPKRSVDEELLPPLPHADEGMVITRFPPEPNGYLHIGHAKAAVVDYEYAQMYGGRFILRFDDTNPASEAAEFYDVQRDDLTWLGIEWDEEYRTSDHLPRHYELAECLIRDGFGYICTCEAAIVRNNRRDRMPCPCRDTPDLQQWEEFFSMQEGSAIMRLKADITSDNTALRDPTLFRIIDHPHPVHGDKYRVWPTYDFSGAIEDSLSGVTHPFRTKEYELRDEVYFYLLDCLGLRKPHLMEFARLAIEGMPVSKRKIKPLIENLQVRDWDDPRLPTLRGLARRGILPEAIKEFVLSQGISKTESTVTFDQVEAHNRKQLDPMARRYFFVPQPVKLTVADGPAKSVDLSHHPSGELGSRTVRTGQVFYLPHEDARTLKPGDVIRLKDLYNVNILKTGDALTGSFAGTDLLPDTCKIQWVTDEHENLEVLVPGLLFTGDGFNPESLRTITGYAEPAIRFLQQGDIVQFERFGFVRMDNHQAIFTHK